jgi:hypothetical protein
MVLEPFGPPGALAARLTSSPVPGGAAYQIGLQAGDRILRLDGLPLRYPGDILGHRYNTDVLYVGADGLPQQTTVFIP